MFLFVVVLASLVAWPAQVVVAQPFTPMLAGGGQHFLALGWNGTVRAWGTNSAGQLGLGNTNPSYQYQPTQVPGTSLNNVVAIAAGGLHSLALLANGSVASWGDDTYGQLGIGNVTPAVYSSPQQVPASSLSNVTALAAGWTHSLALLSSGAVVAWGNDSEGQLGLGNSGLGARQVTPQQVQGGGANSAIAIAAGAWHSLALLANGTVLSWGYNTEGQLGLGNSGWGTNQSTPQLVPVGNLSNVVAIAAGGSHSLALLSNGTVKSWGWNVHGQLGLGNNTNQTLPQQIPSGLSNVIAIAAGDSHSLALLSNGSVKSWGWNAQGQLGLGNTTNQTFPQQIALSNLSDAVAIASGAEHCLALLSNGTVKIWGRNAASINTTPQLMQSFCLSFPAGYAMQFGTLGATTLSMSIPCNTVAGPSPPSAYFSYFNTFSLDPQNAASPGTGLWYGLHTTQAEVLSWLNWGANGFSLALGPLSATGSAVASVTIAPASLTGLTVYGVSVAFNPLTLAVVTNSAVSNHTF